MQNTCALANESPREFELTKRNFISHFSIGSKGARDDAIHLVGRLVTSIAQTWRMILLDDEQFEKAVVFRAKYNIPTLLRYK